MHCILYVNWINLTYISNSKSKSERIYMLPEIRNVTDSGEYEKVIVDHFSFTSGEVYRKIHRILFTSDVKIRSKLCMYFLPV